MKLLNKKNLTKLLAILLLPLFSLTLMFCLNVLNPMALAFLTVFEIENKTDKVILVTPIGAVGPNGFRRQLPYSISTQFYIIDPSKIDYSIQPGEVKQFIYDCDDVQFSEILVRSAAERYRVITTGLHPTQGQYRPPAKKRFEIVDLEVAPFAEEQHLLALNPKGLSDWTLYFLAITGLFSPFFFIVASYMKSKVEQKITEDTSNCLK